MRVLDNIACNSVLYSLLFLIYSVSRLYLIKSQFHNGNNEKVILRDIWK